MKKKVNKKEICAILVHYYANKNQFKKVIRLHSINFSKIIIINNSPKINISMYKNYKITVINNDKNIGLAKALNQGIALAKKKKFNYFALFDQDSLVGKNFTNNMVKYMNIFYQKDEFLAIKPSLFSPVYFNKIINQEAKYIKFKTLRLLRIDNNVKKFFSFPEYVITSGSIIPLSSINSVGFMDDKLFIDFVDIEWCLRARKFKKIPVIINKVRINHFIGDYSVTLFNEKYPIHKPKRMYYFFRNSIYLYKKKYIDLNWKVIDFTRSIFRVFFYLFFVKRRITYFKFIVLGIIHGIKNKMYNYR